MDEIDTLDWKDRIDTDVRKLSERLASVESGVSILTSSFDKFSNAFDRSVDRQRDYQKPQWQVIIGGVTLIVIIIGGFLKVSLAGYIRDLNRVEADVIAIQSNRTSWADPVQDEKLEDIQQEILSMRLNEHGVMYGDATIMERVSNLRVKVDELEQFFNSRLEREIVVHDRIRAVYEDRVKYLETQVFMAHPNMENMHIAPSNESASNRERLHDIEKHIYDGHKHSDEGEH